MARPPTSAPVSRSAPHTLTRCPALPPSLPQSRLFQELRQLNVHHRVLLTGTPLQNNLQVGVPRACVWGVGVGGLHRGGWRSDLPLQKNLQVG